MFSLRSNWQYFSINGLVPNRRQAINQWWSSLVTPLVLLKHKLFDNTPHVGTKSSKITTGQGCCMTCLSTQQAHDAIITSLWRQNDIATSFWRHNDVIIARMFAWCTTFSGLQWPSLMKPRQNVFHFADDILKCIFTEVSSQGSNRQ